jgi:hypothetical protein
VVVVPSVIETMLWLVPRYGLYVNGHVEVPGFGLISSGEIPLIRDIGSLAQRDRAVVRAVTATPRS